MVLHLDIFCPQFQRTYLAPFATKKNPETRRRKKHIKTRRDVEREDRIRKVEKTNNQNSIYRIWKDRPDEHAVWFSCLQLLSRTYICELRCCKYCCQSKFISCPSHMEIIQFISIDSIAAESLMQARIQNIRPLLKSKTWNVILIEMSS